MIFIKPSGTEIEVNDRKETIEHAKSLGWQEKGAKKEAAPKKVAKKKATKKA